MRICDWRSWPKKRREEPKNKLNKPRYANKWRPNSSNSSSNTTTALTAEVMDRGRAAKTLLTISRRRESAKDLTNSSNINNELMNKQLIIKEKIKAQIKHDNRKRNFLMPLERQMPM